MNNFDVEIEQNSLIDIIESNAKKILGLNYSFMYRFFKNFILSEEFDFKFAKTRRSFVLFLIFKDIVELEMHTNEEKAKFRNALKNVFTDVYVGNEKFDSVDKSHILVIDDILIHGRAITTFLLQLTNQDVYGIDKNMIDIDVIARCKNENEYKKFMTECLSGKIQPQENEGKVLQISESLWKDLSNKIVKLILESGYDYTAFSDSLVVHQNPFVRYPQALDIPNLAIQNSVDSKLKVIILDNRAEMSSIEKHSYIVRRLYESPKGKNKYRILDFCILPVFDIESWEKVVENTFDVTLPDDDQLIKRVLLEDETKYTLYTKKSNALIYYYKYFAYLIGLNSLNNIKDDQDILLNLCGKFSFGIESYDSIKNMDRVIDIYKRKNEKIKILNHTKIETINKAGEIWKETVKNSVNFLEDTLSVTFEDFIQKLHEENEKMAMINQEKLQGVFISDLIWILEQEYLKRDLSFDIEELTRFLGIVVNSWDNGLATCNVEIFKNKTDGKNYIGYCVTDGEQACRAGSDNDCLLELKSLNYIKKYTQNNDSFEEKIKKFEEVITKKNISQINISKLERAKKFFKRNQSVAEAISAYKFQPLPDLVIDALSEIID